MFHQMTAHLGYYNIEGIPTISLPKNLCGLCAHELFVSESEVGVIEDTYRLPSCNHTFHEWVEFRYRRDYIVMIVWNDNCFVALCIRFCIRGWLIIGKKQTCPYCKEKGKRMKILSFHVAKNSIFHISNKSWFAEAVQKPLGKTPFIVWATFGLDTIFDSMATSDTLLRPRSQLCLGTWVKFRINYISDLIISTNIANHKPIPYTKMIFYSLFRNF